MDLEKSSSLQGEALAERQTCLIEEITIVLMLLVGYSIIVSFISCVGNGNFHDANSQFLLLLLLQLQFNGSLLRSLFRIISYLDYSWN